MPTLKSHRAKHRWSGVGLLIVSIAYTLLVLWAFTSPVAIPSLFKAIFCVGFVLIALSWYKDQLCHKVLKRSTQEATNKQQLLTLLCQLLEKEEDLGLIIKLLTPLSLILQWQLIAGLTAAKKEGLIRYINGCILIQDRWLELSQPDYFNSSDAVQNIWCRVFNEMEDLQQLRAVLTQAR